MKKYTAVKSILEQDITAEAKAKKIEAIINGAIATVANDIFNDTKSEGLLKDAAKAEKIKNIILVQSTLSDYPEIG